jgi:hypothetical protein
MLSPPGADAQQCSVFIYPSQNGAELNELVFHDRMFQTLTPLCQQDKVAKGYRSSWQFTWAKIITPQKLNQWMVLYTAKSGPRLEAVYFAASSEDQMNKHRFAVERMITGIELPDAKPAAAGPEWKPAPVPFAVHESQPRKPTAPRPTVARSGTLPVRMLNAAP